MRTAAPDILPCLSNWISTNLPNRLQWRTRLDEVRKKKEEANNASATAATGPRVHPPSPP